MKKWYSILCCCVVLFSCSNKESEQAISTANNQSDSTQSENKVFFPATIFLKGQIKILDSLPVTILQINTINGKSDSLWVTKEKVIPFLQPFVADPIYKENLVSLFKESKFNDESTQAVTFTYDPKAPLPDSLTIRHWDVYVDPEKQAVKKIYILKQVKEKDASTTQQLTWQAGKWAKIVIINNKNGQPQIQSDTKWVWDLNE
jgi:hypothetical protein